MTCHIIYSFFFTIFSSKVLGVATLFLGHVICDDCNASEVPSIHPSLMNHVPLVASLVELVQKSSVLALEKTSVYLWFLERFCASFLMAETASPYDEQFGKLGGKGMTFLGNFASFLTAVFQKNNKAGDLLACSSALKTICSRRNIGSALVRSNEWKPLYQAAIVGLSKMSNKTFERNVLRALIVATSFFKTEKERSTYLGNTLKIVAQNPSKRLCVIYGLAHFVPSNMNRFAFEAFFSLVKELRESKKIIVKALKYLLASEVIHVDSTQAQGFLVNVLQSLRDEDDDRLKLCLLGLRWGQGGDVFLQKAAENLVCVLQAQHVSGYERFDNAEICSYIFEVCRRKAIPGSLPKALSVVFPLLLEKSERCKTILLETLPFLESVIELKFIVFKSLLCEKNWEMSQISLATNLLEKDGNVEAFVAKVTQGKTDTILQGVDDKRNVKLVVTVLRMEFLKL